MKVRYPIFIVGMPRSGTTLLQAMINSHPKIALAPETHFFNLCWSRRYKFGTLKNMNSRVSLIDYYTKTVWFKRLNFEDEKKLRFILKKNATSYKLFFEILLKENLKKYPNKVIYGEKTPRHLLYIKDIKHMFPDSVFIHIIRDPRAVFNSLSKTNWGKNRVYTKTALRWSKSMNISEDFKKKFPNQLIDIYYEDLVLNPEKELKKISDFLSINYDPEMLKYYEKSNNLIFKSELWHKNVKKPLKPSRVSNWSTEIDPRASKSISIICSQQMIAKDMLTQDLKFSFSDKITSIYYKLVKYLNSVNYYSKELLKSTMFRIKRTKFYLFK